MHGIRRLARVAMVTALVAVVAIAAGSCSSKKQPTSSQPSETITGEWPADAQGRFQVLVEYWNCGLFNCTWDSLDSFAADVCDDILMPRTDSAHGYIVHKLEAVLSDTLYEVYAEGSVQFSDSSWCDFEITISSRETGMPPAHEQWRVISRMTFTSCGDILTTAVRYTFTRLGNISCKGWDAPVLPRSLVDPRTISRGTR